MQFHILGLACICKKSVILRVRSKLYALVKTELI